MAKIPDSPEEIFAEFAQDYQNVYHDDLQAIILYGSGAKNEYRPGRSDINFLVVLSANAIDALDKALPLIPKWQKRNVAVPLFLTREYILSALDTFPIEFLDMHKHHRVVFGDDVLADLEIKKDDLRLQVERELRGKLIYLRTGFLRAGNDRQLLKEMLSASVSTFVSIFSALLFLQDLDVPAERAAIFAQISAAFGLQNDVFAQILNVKNGSWHGSRRQLQELSLSYIHQIKQLIEKVDQL